MQACVHVYGVAARENSRIRGFRSRGLGLVVMPVVMELLQSDNAKATWIYWIIQGFTTISAGRSTANQKLGQSSRVENFPDSGPSFASLICSYCGLISRSTYLPRCAGERGQLAPRNSQCQQQILMRNLRVRQFHRIRHISNCTKSWLLYVFNWG